MIRTFALTFAILLGVAAFLPTAAAQNDTAARTETQPPADSNDDGFGKLRDRFMRLVRSIQAKGAIDEQDKPFINRMMDEIAAYRAERPQNVRALAMETQLAILLKDHDRVFDLFDQLMQQQPNNAQLAQDWLSYFQKQDMPERADAVIQRLVTIGPDDQAIRRVVAQHLKSKNQYAKAADFLEQVDLDPANNPQAIVLLSDVLFAEHEFQRSLDLLQSIPQDVLEQNPQVKRQVDAKIPDRETYIDLWQTEQELRSEEAAADDLPRAEIIIKDHGRVVVELFENHAPNTVANFITLAEDDFYSETTFHRVLPNFMAQGGDINSKTGEGSPGSGNPGYYIPDEHTREDHRKHFSGSLAMAKTAQANTAGSQFYLSFEPTPWLNGRHTVFGRVIEGLDVARSIEQDDVIEDVNVLRKRDHEYTVQKIPADGSGPAPQSPGNQGRTRQGSNGQADQTDAAQNEDDAQDEQSDGGETEPESISPDEPDE